MSDIVQKWKLLRIDFLTTADDLDKHYTNVNKARVASSSVAAASSVVTLSLLIASFATMGATLAPAIAAGVFSGISGGGGLAGMGAILTGFIIRKRKMKKMDTRWKAFKKDLGNLNVDLWDCQDVVAAAVKVLQTAVKGGKTIYEQVDAITDMVSVAAKASRAATSTTAKTVSTGARVALVLDSAMFGLNIISLGFSVYDIVDASLELHKKTKCQAGNVLREFVKSIDKFFPKAPL